MKSKHKTDSRMVNGWMLILKTKPVLLTSTMPIYWRKATAIEASKAFPCTVVKVQVHYRLPFMQALSKSLKKAIS